VIVATAVTTRVLDGFDDPTFGPERWEELLARSRTDAVYFTWHWQRAWWESFCPGDLLLVVAERDGQPVALAPFYRLSGMIYFVGAGHDEADRLDFLGDVSDPDVLSALLSAAREQEPDFQGFQLDFVPEESPAARLLEPIAATVGLSFHELWRLDTLWVDLSDPALARGAVDRRRLRKLERSYRREATIEVHQLRDPAAIASELEGFFAQHVSRWDGTEHPSRFLDPKVRSFYEHLTRIGGEAGWLRFVRLDWGGRPIAFHYGYSYCGRYCWNIPSFDIGLGRRSPGQLLLRQLLIAALEEGAGTFDFGSQAFGFKERFATNLASVCGFGLYERSRG
jgi:CelD/BcsL family acetyltransferase involved in cellulose biosynthesis